MRRLVAITFVVASLLPALADIAHADDSPKVFMFVREGSRDLELLLTEEVGVMRAMIEDAGYVVDIATPGDEPMVAQSVTLSPTVRLEDVDVSDYAGVILPCMAPARGSPIPERIDEIAAEAVEMGMPFAASRGSVEILAKAGGIADRQFAFAADPADSPDFAGGTFLGTGVVRDDNINTAGICPLASRSLDLPDGTAELTEGFIQSLREAG
jgi:hypothetical protein